MFYFYADESGKSHLDEFIAICGYLVAQGKLAGFNRPWTDRLDYWGAPPIHLREIFHSNPRRNRPDLWLQVKTEWRRDGRWEENRDALLGEMSSIVLEAEVQPIGVIINARHFMSACPALRKKSGDDPIYFAFRRAVLKCIEQVELSNAEPSLGVVLDDDKDTSQGFHERVTKIGHDDRGHNGKRIKSLCFVDDKIYPLIQAADMLAYTSRQRRMAQRSGSDPVIPVVYDRLTKNLGRQPEMLDASELDTLEQEEIADQPQGGARPPKK